MACMVLRCDKARQTVMPLYIGNVHQQEVPLCLEHDEAIKRGDSWRFEPSMSPDANIYSPAILMGDDLTSRELYQLLAFKWNRDTSFGPDGQSSQRITFEMKRLGDNQLRGLELLVTDENIADLRNVFNILACPPGDDSAPS